MEKNFHHRPSGRSPIIASFLYQKRGIQLMDPSLLFYFRQVIMPKKLSFHNFPDVQNPLHGPKDRFGSERMHPKPMLRVCCMPQKEQTEHIKQQNQMENAPQK